MQINIKIPRSCVHSFASVNREGLIFLVSVLRWSHWSALLFRTLLLTFITDTNDAAVFNLNLKMNLSNPTITLKKKKKNMTKKAFLMKQTGW